MPRLTQALDAWGTPEFKAVLKQEVELLERQQLPLQQALAHSSHVSERPVQAMVLNVEDTASTILVRLGIFYTGVVAGCNCADDPSPIDEQNEYCVIGIGIDKVSAETTVSLLPD